MQFVTDPRQFRFNGRPLLGRRIAVKRLLQMLLALSQPLAAIQHSRHMDSVRPGGGS